MRKLRQQGGAIVFAIPPHVLAELGLVAGAEVEVRAVNGFLVARPKVEASRRRYTLAELLEGAEHLQELYVDGALDGVPVGTEMG